MRVAELQAPGLENLVLAARADPRPGAGEVLVRMKAAALNYKDILVAQGFLPLAYPRIPLSDGAGEVVETGEGVTRVKAGDRVCGIFYQNWIAGPSDPAKIAQALGEQLDGMLCDYRVLPEETLVKIPKHLSYAEAACLPCAGVTAWNATTKHVDVKPGMVVLIQGTGGVSLFALQFALMMGARTILLSGSEEKLSGARQLGAHETVNYRETPEWAATVLEMTDGFGADLVVDVGGTATLAQSLRVVANSGHISQVGLLAGITAEISVVDIMSKGAHLDGIVVGSREDFEAMNRAIAFHGSRPVMDRSFAFDEAVQAYQYLADQRHSGKVTIEIA